MKIGDLVKLSAYGKKRIRAEWIDREDIGLIIKVIPYINGSWPPDFFVRWVRSDWSRTHNWQLQRANTRRDLMYVK